MAYLVKYATTSWYPHELACCCNLAPLQLGQSLQRSALLHPLSNQSTLCQVALAGGCEKSRGDCGIMEQLLDYGRRHNCLQICDGNEQSGEERLCESCCRALEAS